MIRKLICLVLLGGIFGGILAGCSSEVQSSDVNKDFVHDTGTEKPREGG